ncbi:hypothetical protein Nos7524_0821 [Nostoc sp. PCC 7524]|nr:hypothetical protein [Nostoc sp. PCC 7524]AFY46725.1 hypothetical protein Nos7524_0821 [Nostoc sp. PCC 7524]
MHTLDQYYRGKFLYLELEPEKTSHVKLQLVTLFTIFRRTTEL